MAPGFRSSRASASTQTSACRREGHRDPRVIVADLSPSVLSGLDLIHRLREDPRTRDIPVIVLTGLTLASVRQQAREAGCNRFLLKPCLPAALAGGIRNVLFSDEDGRVAV
jgi:two-component system cell cycle response regulator DivK